MLETILAKIPKEYNLDKTSGVFFSVFDDKSNFKLSKWVLTADKTLKQTIQIIFDNIISKIPNIRLIILDIPKNISLLEEFDHIKNIDIKTKWIAIIWNSGQNIWAILPNTVGINDAIGMINSVKIKNNITGMVQVYIFETDRIIVSF